jgi:flagellar hook protein FlgE
MWNGVMGIQVHDRALNVVANNSTNTNVYGYKPDEVSFTDLLYSADGTGKGVQLSSVKKVFNQGQIQPTDNPYDVAIEGSGYFVLNDIKSNELFYTRAGNFQMGNDGLLQTPDGMKVLGIRTDVPIVTSTDANVVEFNNDYTKFVASDFVNSNTDFFQSVNARATDYASTATDIGESGNGYKSKSTLTLEIDKMILDYREKLSNYGSHSTVDSTPSTTQITQFNFGSSMNLLNDENDYIEVTIDNTAHREYFDTDIETTLKNFSDRISDTVGLTASVDTTTGVLTIETTIPGKSAKITQGIINNREVFSATLQEATLGTGLGMVESSKAALMSALQSAGAEFLEIKNNISYTNQEDLTALGTIQLKLENMTLSENTFGTISIEENGLVFLEDGDNKFVVGKIQTVAFRAEQELQPTGSNLFAMTEESGEPYYAKDINKIVYNSLELSNANLTDGLATILGLQRAFEANAKSITTSDELLKTAIALRR